MKSLLDSYQLGPIRLKNRIVMAPMTRSRAGQGDAPNELNVEYYRQRASAGLIVTEATQVSKQGQGYLWTPGIYSQEQAEGWKKVTQAVHTHDGKMFLQMWHVGRISHRTLQPNAQSPVSCTTKAAENSHSLAYDSAGNPARVPVSAPRIATIAELKEIIRDFEHAARNVKHAGFDGAEIHGAHGYLFDQFLNSAVNERSDEYGRQSKEDRTRFLLEAFEAVAGVLGAERVGVRISPDGRVNGMTPDPKAEETFLHLAQELTKRRAAYLHIVRGSQLDANAVLTPDFFAKVRKVFEATIIVNGDLTEEIAEQFLADDVADLVCFGTLFISNPDLPERFKNNWPLTPADEKRFYGGDAKGYTDYPAYQKELTAR
jgi:N-ethylmaleimide reductase